MSLLGLDVGTTGCKAIAFDQAGLVLAQSSREYHISTPNPNWAEQDAERVWELAWQALQETVGRVRETDSPKALALSVQGEAIIPVDTSGRALRPAILGMDARTTDENRWLSERFGAEELYQRTGMPVHTINTLPKLIWLQRREPDVWKNADQFLLYEDFFLRRFGGRAVISHCLASRTQMYDLHKRDWAGDLLDSCGIECSHLAPLAPDSGGPVGEMVPSLLRELGLNDRVLLVSGGHDQACAALGSGVVRPGSAMVSTGTAEVLEVAMDSPVLNDTLRQGNVSVYRHIVPGLCLAMTLNHSGGLLLRWFRDLFCEPQVEKARQTNADAYDLILADAPEQPTGLFVLPHFAGSGTPWLDTSSKGAILGLTFSVDRATLAKAILEGLTFELRINLDLLRAGGVMLRELHAVGGGARSPIWLRLKSDICRMPLRVPRVTEAACLGAALLAGVGAGLYTNPASAASHTVHWGHRVEPQDEAMAQYDKRYATYRKLYPTLKTLEV
jgi:xylulokinase